MELSSSHYMRSWPQCMLSTHLYRYRCELGETVIMQHVMLSTNTHQREYYQSSCAMLALQNEATIPTGTEL